MSFLESAQGGEGEEALVHADDEQQHASPDEGSVEVGDVGEHVQAGGEDLECEDGQEDAAQAPGAAVGVDATEDDDEDGEQRVGGAVVGLRGVVIREHDQPGHRPHDAGEHVRADQQARDFQAGEARRRLVRAEHEDVFPEARARDDEPGERRARQEHDEGHGDEADHLRGEHVAERWGYAGDGFAFGEDQGDAAEEFEGAEGGEDRRDFEDRDEYAVDEPTQDPNPQCDAQGDEDGQAEGRGGRGPREGGAQREGGADAGDVRDGDDGQVDAGGEHGEHDAQAHEAEFGELDGHRLPGAHGEEGAGAHGGEEDEQEQEDDGQARHVAVLLEESEARGCEER